MREANWRTDDRRFATLACELFRFQFDHCEVYARFCRARGIVPEEVSDWREIPPVPASAFKEAALTSFDPSRTIKTFRTSGTTKHRRGELHLDTLELYEASLLPSIQRFVFPESNRDDAARMSIRVLANDPEQAPDSSLSHMFGVALDVFGNASSGYDSRDGTLDANALIERLVSLEDGPIALCGTSFAFVHLLEALARGPHAQTKLCLPHGSRIMETGGFKGRSREMPRDELYEALAQRLAVPTSHIVNQYGMTELGSQFYDSTLREAIEGAGGRRRKLGPPWARVRLLDPETGHQAREGEVGIIVIHDLANSGSIAAIQTEDLGRRIDEGFEVLGRTQGAEARGCSIAADARWLEAQR